MTLGIDGNEVVSDKKQILTIGHSTYTLVEFESLLKFHQITKLTDVRRYPHSKRNPQFNRENLEIELPHSGIAYEHFEGLGGRRTPLDHSKNTAWKNLGFRGYADYMETKEFEANLLKLLHEVGAMKKNQYVGIMCAELLPWRCHRFLLADALVTHGYVVKHIISEKNILLHRLAQSAIVKKGKLSYSLFGERL